MKKKDIDLFAILIGIVIGCLFGYFIGMRINNEKLQPVDNNPPTIGNVYVLQIASSTNQGDLLNVLKDCEFNYELINNNNVYYVYTFITTDEDLINERKVEFENLGFSPVVKNEYILDWPNKYIHDQKKYDFYEYAITMLLNSLNGEPIIIDEKYAVDKININIDSNLHYLSTVRNQEVKEFIQLETYKLLFDELNK
ncbi:MAG TPA: hypothetical protein GXZ48_03605 [Acholeplasmataceae bacterium]|nr:hypothetical protein [Acholeplasmataceae bacterium]